MRRLLLAPMLAVMAALIAAPADAKPGKGKGHGWEKSRSVVYVQNRGVRRHGPPDWAPAHGYRAKQLDRRPSVTIRW
jgi:hypothetical protein